METLLQKTRTLKQDWQKSLSNIPDYTEDKGFVAAFNLTSNTFEVVGGFPKRLPAPLKRHWSLLTQSLNASRYYTPLFITNKFCNLISLMKYMIMLFIVIQVSVFIYWAVNANKSEGYLHKKYITGIL